MNYMIAEHGPCERAGSPGKLACKPFSVKHRLGTAREANAFWHFWPKPLGLKKKAHGHHARTPDDASTDENQFPPLIRKPLVEGPVEAEVPAILER